MSAVLKEVEQLAEQTKDLPEPLLREVLDFVGYLRMKHNMPFADAWDKQMDADSEAGAFDSLADEALKQHRDGLSVEL